MVFFHRDPPANSIEFNLHCVVDMPWETLDCAQAFSESCDQHCVV